MKKFYVLFALLLLANIAAHAQPNAVKVVETKVVPQAIRARVPKNGKTWFYGACRLPSNGEVLVHLYKMPPWFKLKLNSDKELSAFELENSQIVRLDIFTTTGTGKRSRYVRLNSADIRCFDDTDKSPRFHVVADFLWVIPKRRKIPLLRLNLANPATKTYAPYGNYFLFSFPKGLKGKTKAWKVGYYTTQPVINGFPNVSDGDPNYTGVLGYIKTKFSFDKVDKNGYIIVTENHLDTSAGEHYEIDYRWLGNGFGAPKQRNLPIPEEPTPTPPATN